MCRLVSMLAALVLVGACGAPRAVQPTLDALASLGYMCDEGAPDGEPSGLTQWRCPAPAEGPDGVVDVEGNDAGVAAMTVVVVWRDTPPDPGAARAVYRWVVSAVPPFNHDPALADALAGWTGTQQTTTIGGVRVTAHCAQNQCWIDLASTPDPMQPLRLPSPS